MITIGNAIKDRLVRYAIKQRRNESRFFPTCIKIDSLTNRSTQLLNLKPQFKYVYILFTFSLDSEVVCLSHQGFPSSPKLSLPCL